MCGWTAPAAMVASASGVCKSLVGIGIPTNAAAGATKTGGATAAAAASGAAARATGVVEGVAAMAVAGVIGALL